MIINGKQSDYSPNEDIFEEVTEDPEFIPNEFTEECHIHIINPENHRDEIEDEEDDEEEYQEGYTDYSKMFGGMDNDGDILTEDSEEFDDEDE